MPIMLLLIRTTQNHYAGGYRSLRMIGIIYIYIQLLAYVSNEKIKNISKQFYQHHIFSQGISKISALIFVPAKSSHDSLQQFTFNISSKEMMYYPVGTYLQPGASHLYIPSYSMSISNALFISMYLLCCYYALLHFITITSFKEGYTLNKGYTILLQFLH